MGSRDDLWDTAPRLAPAPPSFLGSALRACGNRLKSTENPTLAPARSRSASIGATGWRRGQSRANPSRDDFGQMPADCCTHACDARATMTSWGPSGWLPDLRPAMRIDEGHHHFGRRSSSAWAKNAEAFRKISLARRSSRTYGVEPICALVPIAPSTYYEQKARLVDPARARLSLRSGLQRRCEISISTTSYAREAEMEIDGGRPRSGIVSPFLAWMRHQSTTIQKTRNLVRDVFTEARCQCTDHGPCTILALRR